MSGIPEAWRDDLKATLPGIDAGQAMWLANLNAAYPWRSTVGHIALLDSRQVVLKWHSDAENMQREHAAARMMFNHGAPHICPALLGSCANRRTLAFAYVQGAHDLCEVLDSAAAGPAWDKAVEAVAGMHRWAAPLTGRWLELLPSDQTPAPFPSYDLPDDKLLAPFREAGAADVGLRQALGVVRNAMQKPGPWRGFIHKDLQTRHFLCNGSQIWIIDWEHAGIGHTLFDLASILAKTIGHGRRLPDGAAERAISLYAAKRSMDQHEVELALAPVLAYEHWIGVAESFEHNVAETRAELAGLMALPGHDARLTPLRKASAELFARLPCEDLPFFRGLTDLDAS